MSHTDTEQQEPTQTLNWNGPVPKGPLSKKNPNQHQQEVMVPGGRGLPHYRTCYLL